MKSTPSLAHFVWLCTPSRGRTPAAGQSRFRGCLRTGLLRGREGWGVPRGRAGC